jgi:hypothetical protein
MPQRCVKTLLGVGDMNRPTAIKITMSEDRTTVQFLVQFHASTQQHEVRIDLLPDETMTILAALQQLQARYQIPIPANLRPSGPPSLSVVTD